jgi:hypothetical protein
MFAPSNRRATDLMKFFQSVIEKYKLADFFKAHGIHHFVFERRLEDTIEKTENQDLYTRRLQYTVRVQNLMTFEAKSLDSLHFNVGMTRETPSVSRRARMHSSEIAAAMTAPERRVSRCCRGAECSWPSALLTGGHLGTQGRT